MGNWGRNAAATPCEVAGDTPKPEAKGAVIRIPTLSGGWAVDGPGGANAAATRGGWLGAQTPAGEWGVQ